MIYVVYLLVIALLTLLDQLSKKAIVENIALNEKIVIIKDFFNITYVRNYGAGFSILQNARVFLSLISLVAIVVLSYYLYKTKKNQLYDIISYLFIISGALGNLIDRLRLSYVVDFLDFYIFGYDYPVFNVADSFITVGCVMIIIKMVYESIKEKRSARN